MFVLQFLILEVKNKTKPNTILLLIQQCNIYLYFAVQPSFIHDRTVICFFLVTNIVFIKINAGASTKHTIFSENWKWVIWITQNHSVAKPDCDIACAYYTFFSCASKKNKEHNSGYIMVMKGWARLLRMTC